jgi:hypothetical protein
MRCQMGVILRATPNETPHYDEPFVIVDQRLLVQAISHGAEAVLKVEEPVGVGIPLERFLVSADGEGARGELADSVHQAIVGIRTSSTLELRAVTNGEIRLAGRVTSCGPPRAALLILSPLEDGLQGSINGSRSKPVSGERVRANGGRSRRNGK